MTQDDIAHAVACVCAKKTRALLGNTLYTTTERRRLARHDSGPGRRLARRVSMVRPMPGFTRTNVTNAALAWIPGLRHRDIEIDESAERFTVTVRLRCCSEHAITWAASMRDYVPMHVRFVVEATK